MPWSKCGTVLKADIRPSADLDFDALRDSQSSVARR